MRRTIGRRPLFFFVATLACAALVPATPSDLRWVDWFTAALGAFWTIMLALEDLLGPGAPPRPERHPRVEDTMPFAPPPRPGAGGRPAE